MSNVILGTAVADALGMPFEKKLSNDPLLLAWDGKTFLGSEHHKLKPGQWTDDSQFSQAVAQSLIQNNGFNPQDLADRYVDLFTSETIRGYGRTTLLAVTNLLEGKHWSESGVAGSYGNGTAMRAAPFGIYFRNDLKMLVEACKIDSAITHASEEAEAGSIAIALATAYAVNNDLEDVLERLHEKLPDSKVKTLVYSLSALLDTKHIAPSTALRVLGTKADVRETVPSALYCFLKFKKYGDAVIAAIRAGGDTDTTGAIVGAMFGAKLGMNGMDRAIYQQVEDFDKLVELDSQLYNRSNDNFLRN
jgi:ADP-ribosylglycohydrolase